MSKGKGFTDRGRAQRDAGRKAQEAKAGKGKSSVVINRKAGSGGVREPRVEDKQ